LIKIHDQLKIFVMLLNEYDYSNLNDKRVRSLGILSMIYVCVDNLINRTSLPYARTFVAFDNSYVEPGS